MVEDTDQAILISRDKGFEGARFVVAHANHEARVRIADSQLCACFADGSHEHLDQTTLIRSIKPRWDGRGSAYTNASVLRRSCPQAASISEPLRLRTLTLIPERRKIVVKAARSSSRGR